MSTSTGTFICEFCSKSFARRKYLTNHLVIHKEPTVPCEICHKLYVSTRRKNKHISHVHNESGKKFECADCGYKCSTKSTLIVHVRKHTNEKPFQCAKCDLSYKTKPDLKKHFMQVHEGLRKSFACELCDKSFGTRPRLQDHISSFHYQITENCQYCSRKFKTLRQLKKHIKCRHEDPVEKTTHPCKMCSKVFLSRSGLLSHIRYKHKETSKLVCKCCNAELQSKASLRVHIKSRHLKLRDEVCPVCARAFFGRNHLKRHMRTHTSVRVSCPKCNKQLCPGSLKAHMDTHRKGENSFVCPICKKGFKNSARLANHKRIHKVREQHNCALCKKTFVTIYGLKAHLVKHMTVGKPFKCPSCEMHFQIPGLVRAHFMRVHERRMCSVCSRYFKTRSKRIAHMNEKHPGWRLVLKCPKCKHEFTKKSSLENHMKRHDKYVCNICTQEFIMKHLFDKHKAARHNPLWKFVCKQCKYRFCTNRALVGHTKRVHSNTSVAMVTVAAIKVEPGVDEEDSGISSLVEAQFPPAQVLVAVKREPAEIPVL